MCVCEGESVNAWVHRFVLERNRRGEPQSVEREKRRHLLEAEDGWEWQEEPGSLSSVFAWVRSAGED